MIKINGKTYFGNNIQISNNRVIIDGLDVSGDHKDSKEISIQVEGNIENLSVDYAKSILVNGNVNSLKSGSGDVDCKDVTGDIKTGSGDIECGNVGGGIETGSGNVKCETVGGSVKTSSGDIKHRK